MDTIQITSGGQDFLGEGTRRTGSTRHDGGRAADIQLVVNGAPLTFTDKAAHPTIIAFVTSAAAAGANGIGAGVGYMGNRTIHVGFGTSVNDTTELTWGAGGRAANSPKWLRSAAEVGWAAPDLARRDSIMRRPGRYVVIARNGLKLRGGPGTNFDSEKTLPAGTELEVIEIGNHDDASWVPVDLEGDNLLDGYVYANFLASSVSETIAENTAEDDQDGRR